MLKYLLDTNIAIYVIKRRPPAVVDIFNRYAGQIAVSSITVAELCYGVEKSAYPARNEKTLQDFLSRLIVLPYTEKAAVHFGNIRALLSKSGQLIGENDLHIAAHARSESLVLVTNNLREFSRVEGLRLENWIATAP